MVAHSPAANAVLWRGMSRFVRAAPGMTTTAAVPTLRHVSGAARREFCARSEHGGSATKCIATPTARNTLSGGRALSSSRKPQELVLYGTRPCPFVERVQMCLKQAAVEYETKTFDLGSLKDRDALKKMSPYGRVPILALDHDKHIFESMAICQYVDEVFVADERRRLMRGTPYEKALTRSWTHFVNQRIASQMWQTLLCTSEESIERNYDDLIISLEAFDIALRNVSGGPFFLGTELSYLDVMVAPFLHRRVLISHFKDREMFPAEAMRLKQLCEALEESPIYKSTMVPPEELIAAYKPYVKGNIHPKFGWH